MAEGERIEVDLDKWNRLLEDSAWLACLEVVGVDNWEGYSTAWQLLKGEISEDDI